MPKAVSVTFDNNGGSIHSRYYVITFRFLVANNYESTDKQGRNTACSSVPGTPLRKPFTIYAVYESSNISGLPIASEEPVRKPFADASTVPLRYRSRATDTGGTLGSRIFQKSSAKNGLGGQDPRLSEGVPSRHS